MDLFIELLRYSIIIIIGITLVNWYERKKGWSYRFRISLYYILLWRTAVLLMVFLFNIILDLFFISFLSIDITYSFFQIFFVIVTYFINIFLGVKIFSIIYKKNAQESLVVILIIVIIEMILESFLLYIVLIPETIKWLYY
ncbi:MAG: hypothetical protein HWN79_00770 [Candidatus Lokiarchaeota archaeon]|nr:hypothetical protein [Candidatus Lokiarchaeota archaeon]